MSEQTPAAAELHRAFLAAPKDCWGRARMLDLRDLSGLGWGAFDVTVTALHRAYLVEASWSNKPTTLPEDNASVLIDGTSRHLLVWGRWNERPAHDVAACKGHPEERLAPDTPAATFL